MEYHGFRSISEYERECARLNFKTRRIPFHSGDGGKYFALVTSCPGHPTGTSVESWALFSADETRFIMDGIISGGVDVNYLGKLSAHGYFPDGAPDAPAPPPVPELPTDESGQVLFLF